MSNHQPIDAFLAWQEGRAFSPRTIRRRRLTLTQFARQLECDILKATPIDIETWLATKPSPKTRHAYRSDLVGFYRWASRRGFTDHDPTAIVDPIKVPRSLPRPLPAPDVMHAFWSAPNRGLQLMIACAAFAGLRVSEIAALDASDISTHTKPPILTVRNGKGGRDRIVPIHPLLLQSFGRLPRAGRVFPRRTGDSIGASIARHLHALGYDATAHQLRHSFGTQAAEAARGNMVLVQQLMGHGSIETTMGYVGWAGGPAAEVVAQMYHRDRAA